MPLQHGQVPRSSAWVAGAAALLWLAWAIGGLLAEPLARAVHGHETIGGGLFVLSTAIAVVVPMFSNLPLVPAAVLVWGPWWTAAALLGGWTIGSWASFVLGRLVRRGWLAEVAWLRRVADVDPWLHPRHTLLSLVALRMVFPVDVLSFALGLFSARVTVLQLLASTVVGAAPFALLFAFGPTLTMAAQALLLAVCVLLFAVFAAWVRAARRRTAEAPQPGEQAPS